MKQRRWEGMALAVAAAAGAGAGAGRLPRFIVIKSVDVYDHCVFYTNAQWFPGYAHLAENSVFNTEVKIEVEPAKTAAAAGNNFVHLRFCSVNRYLGRNSNGYFAAQSKQPEEDTSNPSCTLFQPTFLSNGGSFYLTHVQSRGRVLRSAFHMKFSENEYTTFRYVDWDSLVKMPGRVSFKGDNGKYLSDYWFQDLPYLRFWSDDPNNEWSGYEIHLQPDGHVKIKSLYFGKFWRYAVNWIWADSDGGPHDNDSLFWPVKIDNETIALRAANNNFCKGLSVDWKDDCLNAAVPNIAKEARLKVAELVLERRIYNVRYRMEDARIFDEKPYVAGTTTAYNRADGEASIAVEMGFEDERSYSFNRSLSLTAGVTSSIEADVLGIFTASIEFSFEVNGSFEWGESEVKTKSVKATGTVPVPARSKAIVNYVGTMGTCNVPFSYIQQDRMSTDGRIVETEFDDGMFTGVNCYNFSFEVMEYQPL